MTNVLDKINDKNIPNTSMPDPLTEDEEINYEAQRQKLFNKGLKQNIKERKKYAKSIYFLIIGWLIGVFILLVFNGFGELIHFKLSEKIMITLISGTTINILGIFIIVVNYLFKKN